MQTQELLEKPSSSQTHHTPRARMRNPLYLLPNAMSAIQALGKVATDGAVPHTTLNLVHLRASQINGCGFCVDMHARDMRKAGESDERIWAVAAWRESPHFSAAERAALALTEAATRISDQSDAVPDAVWNEAARHYDETQLASLVLNIALINFFNRINVPVRQVAGEGAP